MARDGRLEYRVAHAVHLGNSDQQPTENETTDCRPRPFRSPPNPVAHILDEVEQFREGDTDHPCAYAERCAQEVFGRAADRESRQRQERMIAEQRTSHHSRGHTGQDNRADRLGSDRRRISSIAKNAPARGVLKVAEIPPAAPQATSSRIRSVLSPSS